MSNNGKIIAYARARPLQTNRCSGHIKRGGGRCRPAPKSNIQITSA